MGGNRFQSTRPIRGATRPKIPIAPPISNFNPRAPYGARLAAKMQKINRDIISIHAPHTGRDFRVVVRVHNASAISIHAPHTGRDPVGYTDNSPLKLFQSTRPIRGATVGARRINRRSHISIHAPHTGRDMSDFTFLAYSSRFQSTRPIRGATCWAAARGGTYRFQSTRPIRGATTQILRMRYHTPYFNPRAPYGARRHKADADGNICPDFNPRAPYGARHCAW